MNRRNSLAALAALTLTACGGGGESVPSFIMPVSSPEPPPKPKVLHFGDSFTTGAGVPLRLSREDRLPMFEHIDRAHGGMSSKDLWLGRSPSPHAPFVQHLQTDPSAAVVFRFGGVEALNNYPEGEFYQYMAELCIASYNAGRNIFLIGACNLPETEIITSDMLKRYWANDKIMRDSGLPYIDLSGVPIGADEMFDPLHPGVAPVERMCDAIALQVRAHL